MPGGPPDTEQKRPWGAESAWGSFGGFRIWVLGLVFRVGWGAVGGGAARGLSANAVVLLWLGAGVGRLRVLRVVFGFGGV